MTLQLLKKRPTTVPAETSARSFLGRLLSRSASQSLLISAALVSSVAAQQTEQQHYAPPVHVQPAAWSVLESEAELNAGGKAVPVHAASVIPAAPAPVSRGAEIAKMAHYMRAQNEAASAAKNAQVNAALHQLQQTKALAAQGQKAPRQTAPRPIAPRPNVLPPANRQPYAYPPRRVAQNTATAAPQRSVTAAERPTRSLPAPPGRPTRTTNRTVRPTRTARAPVNQQPREQPGIGLQDRISKAFRKTFTRKKSDPQVAATAQSQTVPVYVEQPGFPTVAATPNAAIPNETVYIHEQPQNPNVRIAYRSTANPQDRVIVPSFVDAEPEFQLAASQQAVGSGLAQPRVLSHSQPLSHGASPQASIFQSASAQDEDSTVDERLRKLDDEFDSLSDSQDDSELPDRPSDEPTLDLDDDITRDDDSDDDGSDDERADEETRRIRTELEAEQDALEDDEEILDDDIFDEDEDEGPPVFDERGCEELRELLMGSSIRDISLDVSPPASPRRYEIGSISRSWTDASGNLLATGTMTDLRRGYVILDTGQKIPYSKLGEADWNAIAENWLLPSGCSIGYRGSIGRNWVPQTVSWQASNLCHKPLYFENVQLERYGHSRGPFAQPFHSAFHFFGSLLFLPYQTGIHPANECRYALGYYRPGSCAPWIIEPIPFSRQAIRRQVLASLGASFYP